MLFPRFEPQDGNCAVVYLEDDDATAYIFQAAMRETAPKVILFRVTDGEQALHFLLHVGVYRDAPRPSLVILDINVPKKNGFEVLAAMQCQKELMAIPAVVFSSSILADDRERAFALGALNFFVKSRDWDGFLETAKEICSMLP